MQDTIVPSIERTSPLSVSCSPKRQLRVGPKLRPTQVETQAIKSIEKRAKAVLESHPHFVGRRKWVHCHCDGECLVLSGIVPTYYLKQLAQEAMNDLNSPFEINNCIHVANPSGFVSPESGCPVRRKPR